MRVVELLERYVEFRGDAGTSLSVETVRGFRDSLKFLPPAWPVSEAEIQPARGRVKKLAIESQRSHIRRWRTIGRFAASIGLSNPFEGLVAPKPDNKPRRTFTDAEVAILFAAARDNLETAYLTLLFDSGIRKGECPLWVHQVKDECLVVSGKSGPKLIPIFPDTRDLVLSTARGSRLWVAEYSGIPLSLAGLNSRYRRLIQRSGLTGAKVGQHTARHTFATALMDAGADLSVVGDQLGHKDPRSTQIYVHLSVGSRLNRMRRFRPRYRSTG